MTRRHFEALADAMAHTIRTAQLSQDPHLTAQIAITKVADACEDMSPRFDRARFVDACWGRE